MIHLALVSMVILLTGIVGTVFWYRHGQEKRIYNDGYERGMGGWDQDFNPEPRGHWRIVWLSGWLDGVWEREKVLARAEEARKKRTKANK